MPSHLGKGRTNVFPAVRGNYFLILSKFKSPGRTGMYQFQISPIPWLEHIPIEYLGEKVRKFTAKPKKNPSKNPKCFFNIFGLVTDFRQFKLFFIFFFHWFSLYCRDFSLICHHFVCFAVKYFYFAEGFLNFVVSSHFLRLFSLSCCEFFIILPWFSLFCRGIS